MSRLRTANEKAVNKTLQFLFDLKLKCSRNDNTVSTTQLQELHGISKSTYSICKKMMLVSESKTGIIWESIQEPDRKMALCILEYLRQKASKRIDIALGEDFTTAIDRLTTSMNTLSIQNENAAKRPGMLSKALNQAPMQSTTLFDAQLNNDAKLFKLIQAIAGPIFSSSLPFIMNSSDSVILDSTSDFIIEAAKNLLNKLNN